MLRQARASRPGAMHIPINRRLVALEPARADLLDRICADPLIDAVTVAVSRPPAQPHQKVEGKKRRKVKVVA